MIYFLQTFILGAYELWLFTAIKDVAYISITIFFTNDKLYIEKCVFHSHVSVLSWYYKCHGDLGVE